MSEPSNAEQVFPHERLVGPGMNTACEYVRRCYGVPAQIGRRVVVYGKPGVIATDRGHYLGVNFDAHKPGVIHNAHPTSEVEYGELAAVRPMTRSQKRYMEYLDVADLYESFAAFLSARSNAGASPTECREQRPDETSKGRAA